MVEGSPSRPSSTRRFGWPRPRTPCGAASPTPRSKTAQDGLREIADREWPRYHLRLFRVGMRAAADVAEVARARRDGPTRRTPRFAPAPTLGRRSSRSLPRCGLASRAWPPTRRTRRSRRSRRNGGGSSASRRRQRGSPPRSAGGHARTHTLWPTAAGVRPKRCSATAIARRRPPPSGGAPDRHGSAGAPAARRSVEALAARSRLDLSTDEPRSLPVEPTAGDPFGLTRRERDVLPLLVKGRTNRQIAEELFISENTAGVHVSNILGKLGASTRTEAAGIAARLGLGV